MRKSIVRCDYCHNQKRSGAKLRYFTLALTALFLAGCTDNTALNTASGTTSGIYQMLREATGLSSSDQVEQSEPGQGPQTQPGLPALSIVCPPTEVRAGTAHYVFYAANQDPRPRNVQFQGTLTKTARECAFGPNSVQIKFGFAGRVLIGPMGGAGSVVLPVRVILSYREGEVAWTKLYNVPVNISGTENSTFFMHVEENFEYTVPAGHRMSDYTVYIGFDGTSTEAGSTRASN